MLAINEIKKNLVPLTELPIHHTTGFSHPKLLIYTDRSPWHPEVSTWGLVFPLGEGQKQQKQLWNKTLNARGRLFLKNPHSGNRPIIAAVSFMSMDFMNTIVYLEKPFRLSFIKKTTNLSHWPDFGVNEQIRK